MTFALNSLRVLTPDGPVPASIVVESNGIAALDSKAPGGIHCFDVGNALVLPGIVDIHGDAFERQIMPRPGVTFPLSIALADTDAQLLAAGITTAFHGITYSWEPGLRGAETTRRVVHAVDRMRDRFRCDTRIHLRFETYNLDALDEIVGWIERGVVDLLAFNDHIPHFQEKLADGPHGLSDTAKRAGLDIEAFEALVNRTAERAACVPDAVQRLAAASIACGIAMLSHDDETPEMRRFYHNLGCRIAEFPVDRATAETAIDLGNDVVLGAPNILRGGSHCGRLSTRQAIEGGYCSILASDYYYPTLLHGVFALVRDGVLGLSDAWRMVSEAPARAAGLDDRGTLAEGNRADLIVVDDGDAEGPVVRAVCVKGRFVYASGEFASEPGIVSCAA